MRSQARWLVPPFLAALLVRPAAASAQGSLVLGVETSAAAVASDAAVADRQFLVRVIPELQAGHTLPRGWRVDTTVAVTGSVRAVYDGTARGSSTEDASLHRAWVRLASTHFEARVGRQRISFGSASLFRPLMWFDRVDARDPTQYSEGVYAALARYVTTGNTSFSGWAMYGNDEVRGWDAMPTESGKPEFGGRVQSRMPRGDVGVTYHRRRVDTAAFAGGPTPGAGLAPVAPAASDETAGTLAGEDRIGLDGKWDLNVGVWVEAVATRCDSSVLENRWRRAVTVGADYTFGLGRGLTLLTEHFYFESPTPLGLPATDLRLSALVLSYPLGVADMLTGAVYYEWNREDWFRFVEWRRTYDHWRIHLIGFWNPDRASVFAAFGQTSALTGRGGQIVVVVTY